MKENGGWERTEDVGDAVGCNDELPAVEGNEREASLIGVCMTGMACPGSK